MRIFARGLSQLVALLLAILLIAPPAHGWNEAGHRIIAAIAYDHLTPEVRARVDDLIRRHPDYERVFLARIPSGTRDTPGARARAAFIAASYWPDLIRSDDRFYTDTNRNARPTPLLPGFPDMGRHTNWHYYDIPFSTDGTPLESQAPPHALSEIQRLLSIIKNGKNGVAQPADSSLESAYALPWLLHLIGDVHNPLHATSRYLTSQPRGDQGGNLVIVADGSPDGQTLHSLWDSAGGTNTSGNSVNRTATELTSAYLKDGTRPEDVESEPRNWLIESFVMARQQVYTFGNATGSEQQPLVLPASYRENSKSIANRQLASAGLRLAKALNLALD